MKKIKTNSMSGKLIMKRKWDERQQSTSKNKIVLDESSTTPSTSTAGIKGANKSDETFTGQSKVKRNRTDTPPPEPEDLDFAPIPQANKHNHRHLLEAIQLKIKELQNELDIFEHDVEAHEESYYNLNDLQQNQMTEQDAEALGFAMCAEETMLFLQREGVPRDSLLYTRLQDALLGRSHADPMFPL